MVGGGGGGRRGEEVDMWEKDWKWEEGRGDEKGRNVWAAGEDGGGKTEKAPAWFSSEIFCLHDT